jgi:CheY-like chemotaxis protein
MLRPNSTSPEGRVLILLVNTNAGGRTARKAVLEEQGYRVVVSASAADALDQCSRETFDLVITDDKLQRIDGIDLITRLHTQRPELPVILISEFVEALGLNEENTGADAVIQKSANEVSHLIRATSRLLRRRKPPESERPLPKSKAKGV